MKRIAPIFLLISIFFISATFTCEEKRNPRKIIHTEVGVKMDERLTPYIQSLLAVHDSESSVSVGVTYGDQIVYARSFGYANIETRELANLRTLYHVSSISKTFIAAAIVKLESEGLLDIDDPVVKYIPYFKLASASYMEITLQQLLTHTSGLPAHNGLDNWESPSYSSDALEVYIRSASHLELEFSPGTDFSYSDIGFILLGEVIENVAGGSFEEYVDRQILKPCNMKASTFRKGDELLKNWAAPHIFGTNTQVWKHYPYNRMYAPSNAFNSNVIEMCRWSIMNLHHGKSEKGNVLDSTSHALLFQPHVATPWGKEIGYSWFIQDYLGMTTWMHTGEDIGFSSQCILYPEEDVAIVVLANGSNSRTARIANAAMEIFKDMEPKSYQVSGKFLFCKEWNERGLDSAKNLWKSLLADSTDNYFANEWELNIVGHGLIFTGEIEKAKQVFQFNIDLFPEEPNVYDSYGDALFAECDTLGAISYFMKSMSVDSSFTEPLPKLDKLKDFIDGRKL
ncbi:MAG: serine hydrolase [Cryomorphaceae bacterium]|nr:serine hydrolase [Cryomorphaceae bacterium]